MCISTFILTDRGVKRSDAETRPAPIMVIIFCSVFSGAWTEDARTETDERRVDARIAGRWQSIDQRAMKTGSEQRREFLPRGTRRDVRG